jgi:hypothetical protein
MSVEYIRNTGELECLKLPVRHPKIVLFGLSRYDKATVS